MSHTETDAIDELERPFFAAQEDAQLYCFLHRAVPNESVKARGIVICPPHPWEYQGCDRMFVQLGRRLASEHIHALRFDYRGTRESTGDLAAATVRTQVADIMRATEELERAVGDVEIGLLGARMGATLAALAAAESEQIEFTVLWDPVVKGRRYFDRCLRAAVATIAAESGESGVTRKTLAGQLGNGQSISVAGHELTPRLYNEGSDIDLTAANERAIPALVLQTHTREPRATDPTRAWGEGHAQLQQASRFAWIKAGAYWAGAGPFGVIEDRPELIGETIRWLRKLN